MKSPIMTREDYEAENVLYRFVDLKMEFEDASQDLEKSYPKGTRAVQEELKQRGLDATDWRVTAYVQNNELRKIGRTLVWYRFDIDAFATQLEAAGGRALTRDALYRLTGCDDKDGLTWQLTWQEERDIQAREAKIRLEHLSHQIECSVFELLAAEVFGDMFIKWFEGQLIKRYTPACDFHFYWYDWQESHIALAKEFIVERRGSAEFQKQVVRQENIAKRKDEFWRLWNGRDKS